MLVGIVSSKTDKSVAFGNKREDYYDIDYLAGGEKPILPNKKTNILAALQRFSKNSDDDNIQFLLNTASSLQYGVKANSQFAINLGVKNVTKLENTDWYAALDKAILRAIEHSTSSEKADFQTQYLDIFGTVEPLSQQEKEILDYREAILSSDEMKNALSSPENLAYSADITKYLDYFTASSEISKKQKHECLKQMAYFLSPEYKINPQLKDKKLQALSEILTDIVVKTPDNPVMSIKGVNQRNTGMCAAISICRKALAYEDKSRYLDIIMHELNDSKKMEVFDVTKLGTNEKILVNKANIDYDDALDNGYRIIDASAHNWMYLAQNSGDGKVEAANYIPFDKENDEIFHDSILYKDLEGSNAVVQGTLRLLIKEREVISRIEKTDAAKEKLANEFPAIWKDAEYRMGTSRAGLIDIVKTLFPDADEKYAAKLVASLLNSSENKQVTGMKKPVEINIKEPDDVVKDKIKTHIIANSAALKPSHSIDTDLNRLYTFYLEYKTAEKSVSREELKKTPEANFARANSFYKLGLIQRNAFLSGIMVDGRLLDYERKLKIPTVYSQFNKHMDNLRGSLSNPERVEYWAKKLGVRPTKEDVENKFALFQQIMDVELPHNVDKLLSGLGMGDRVHFMSESIKNLKKEIEAGDEGLINHFSAIYGCKPEKKELLPRLEKDLKSLEDPDNAAMMSVARNFGFELESDIAYDAFETIQNQLMSGNKDIINAMLQTYKTTTRVNNVVKQFADFVNQMINQENTILELVELPNRYDTVVNMYEKDGLILNESDLDILRKKFEAVRKEKLQREKTKERGEKEDKSKGIYHFSTQERDVLEKIEKSFSRYKKYANYQYRLMHRIISPQLEELYSSYGSKMGLFWVQEEGHSGLFSAQQVRIFEQMTGKAYYIESDIDTAADKIKKGNGSGIVTTSVLDDEFALHAQYSPGVSSVNLLDPVSHQKEKKEVLWQDNSWGNAENDELWHDSLGNQYTSYEKGYGGKGGYIVSSDHKIGKTVDFFRSSYGIDKKYGDKVSQFFDVVLPGYPKEIYKDLSQLYEAIFDLGTAGEDLEELDKNLKAGRGLNIETIEDIEKQSSQRTDELLQRLDSRTYTREEFEALPKNDKLRFLVEKQSLINSLFDATMILKLKYISSYDSFAQVKELITEQQREAYACMMNKVGYSVFIMTQNETEDALNILFKEFEKNYGIKLGSEEDIKKLFEVEENDFDGSYESIRNNLILKAHEYVTSRVQDPQLADKFIRDIVAVETAIVDKTFKFDSVTSFVKLYGQPAHQLIKIIDAVYEPKNNDELLGYIKKLQEMNKKEFDEFLDKAPEDMGIDFADPYQTLQKLQTDNYHYREDFIDTVHKTFKDVSYLTNGAASSMASDSSQNVLPTILADLTFLAPQKTIKSIKRQFFDKYKVLPAFPNTVVVTDEQIEETADEYLTHMRDILNSAYELYIIKDMQNKAAAFKKITQSGDLNKKAWVDELTGLYNLVSKDKDLKELSSRIKMALDELSKNDREIDRQKINEQVEIVNAMFDSLFVSVYTDENIESSLENVNENLKRSIELIVNGNIDPRYRDSVRQKMNAWINAYLKYDENDADKNKTPVNPIESAYDALVDEIIKRHITKSPLKLLGEYMKEIQKQEPSQYLSELYRANFELVLNTAKQARVQYYLMNLAGDGIVTKLPLFQNIFVFKDKDGNSFDITSDAGMLELVDSLSRGNNKSLLNLFLIQAGLTERAVDVITKSADFEASKDNFKNVNECLLVHIDFMKNIQNLYQQFLKDNNINYDSLISASEHWLKVLEQNKSQLLEGDKLDVAKTMLEEYIKTIKKDVKSYSSKVPADRSLMMLTQGHQYSYKDMEESLNSSIKAYYDVAEFYKSRWEMLKSIEVADPELNKRKQEFKKKVDNLVSFYEKSSEKLIAASNKIPDIG